MTLENLLSIASQYPRGTVFLMEIGALDGIGSAGTIPAYPTGHTESRRVAVGNGKSLHVEIFQDYDSFHIDFDPAFSPIRHLILDLLPFILSGPPEIVDLRG